MYLIFFTTTIGQTVTRKPTAGLRPATSYSRSGCSPAELHRRLTAAETPSLEEVAESAGPSGNLSANLETSRRNSRTGRVAQWIRHRSTEPEIAGSSPAVVIYVAYATGNGVKHSVASLLSCEEISAADWNRRRWFRYPRVHLHGTGSDI